MISRRHFLQSTLVPGIGSIPLQPLGSHLLAVESTSPFSPRIKPVPELARQLGLVSASLSRQLSASPTTDQFTLLELPGILRDELDLDILDLNTMNFPMLEMAYAEKLRASIEKAGCVATNLKMNQKVDMASADASERAEAIRQYRAAIDAAAVIGCRWVRPLPRNEAPDRKRMLAAFDQLIDYAGERGITLLVENFGWMMKDPNSVVSLVDAIGPNRVAIGPDTGNWSDNEVREAGLRQSFPRAVTCDFKARVLDPEGRHQAYDLKRCFEIGWNAGFKGPWNFEYGHPDRQTAFRGIGFLRDSLRAWMKEKDDA